MGSLLDDLRAEAADYIAACDAERKRRRSNRPGRNYVGTAIPLDVFQRMLDATPYTGGPPGLDNRHDYDGWLAFAMDCHEAAGGDEADYLEAFIQWCHNDPHGKAEWTRERIERHWQSFDTDPAGAARTRASWFKLLCALGHPEFIGEAGPTAADDFESGVEEFTEEHKDIRTGCELPSSDAAQRARRYWRQRRR